MQCYAPIIPQLKKTNYKKKKKTALPAEETQVNCTVTLLQWRSLEAALWPISGQEGAIC